MRSLLRRFQDAGGAESVLEVVHLELHFQQGALQPAFGRSTLHTAFAPSSSRSFGSHFDLRKSRVSAFAQYSDTFSGFTSQSNFASRQFPSGGQAIAQSIFGIGLSNTWQRQNAASVVSGCIGSNSPGFVSVWPALGTYRIHLSPFSPSQ